MQPDLPYKNGPDEFWVREEVCMKMAIWFPLVYTTVAILIDWGRRTLVGPQRRGERIKLTALFHGWIQTLQGDTRMWCGYYNYLNTNGE